MDSYAFLKCSCISESVSTSPWKYLFRINSVNKEVPAKPELSQELELRTFRWALWERMVLMSARLKSRAAAFHWSLEAGRQAHLPEILVCSWSKLKQLSKLKGRLTEGKPYHEFSCLAKNWWQFLHTHQIVNGTKHFQLLNIWSHLYTMKACLYPARKHYLVCSKLRS